jgi:hypothetical protein
MDEAIKLAEAGKVVAAIARCQAVLDGYASLPVGQEARTKMDELRRSVAGKPWAQLVEAEAKGEFDDIVACLKAEWKLISAGAPDAGNAKVEASDILLRMTPEKRDGMMKRLTDISAIYTSSSYGPRCRQLIERVKTAMAQAAQSVQLSSAQ